LLKMLGLSQVVLQVAGSAVYLPLITEHQAQQVLHDLTEDWTEQQ
jgi:membrane protein YdbS with pleckstrin-like domain